MIKGILFDMDGVIVDSESFMSEAAVMMFSELGIAVSEQDFKPFSGMGENRYLGGVAEKYGIHIDVEKAKERAYNIYTDIVRNNLVPLPGAKEFILKCRNSGFKLALATSADRIKMEVNLKEIDLPLTSFNSIITGMDVTRKKPFPDIYVKAAESLGLKTNECLVVEDAVSGIEAGKAAGCRCLGLTTSFNAEALKDADWICDTLLNVPVEAVSW
jgi:beta-phosphoglucomutase